MQAKAASQAGQARRSASHVAQLAVGKPACMPIALCILTYLYLWAYIMHTYLLILMGLYICILTHLWQLGHYAYILALTYGIQVIAASQTGQPACQLPTRQPSSRTTQPASQPKKNESSKQAIKQTSEKHINQPTKQQQPQKANQPTNQPTDYLNGRSNSLLLYCCKRRSKNRSTRVKQLMSQKMKR